MDTNFSLEYWKAFDGPFPQAVFAFKPGGVFAFGVTVRTKGMWGHFMWLIARNTLASQSWWFGKHPIDDYSGCLLKFVDSPAYSADQRQTLLTAINKDLALGKWKTRYDVLGVIGELFGIRCLNRRNLFFCSERGSYLTLVDPEYNLVHPSPTQLNEWMKRRGIYEVTGRYSPD